MTKECIECPDKDQCDLIGIGFGSPLCEQNCSRHMTSSWDNWFMSLVYLISMKSKDPRSKVGAVIVSKDNTILSLGYNGLPRNLDYTPDRITKPLKQYFFEHAERNTIYNSIRNHSTIKDSVMYTCGMPCPDCARAIIQSGIIKLVIDAQWNKELKEQPTTSYNVAIEMLQENNIEIIYWKGNIIRKIKKQLNNEIF